MTQPFSPARLIRMAVATSLTLAAVTSPLHHLPATARAQTVADGSVSGTASLTLTPPIASGAPRQIHGYRSLTRTGQRLHGLGLRLPDARTAVGAAPTVALGAAALPASVDLSQYDMPVGDQGQVNSCASWSTGYSLLGWYANKYGLAGKPYAPMYVYSQLTSGQNVGTSFEGNLGLEQQQGIDTQSDYTQGNYDYVDQPTASERANAAQFADAGWNRIYLQNTGANAQQAIETAMANGQPVVVGIPVYGNFMYASASSDYVDVPPAGSYYYGGHGILAVKYDSNGLWIENQWGTGWGLNGYAELSWAFVNQYMMGAYTITGFNAPQGTSPTATAVPSQTPVQTTPAGPTATAAPPTATPATAAQVLVSPASGLPGSSFTISGSGFGSGTVMIIWNGSLAYQLSTSTGSFSVSGYLSSSAVAGPRPITAYNVTTGRQASTTFTVLAANPTATATQTPVQPTATATQAPVQPTATATATQTAIRPTSTATQTPIQPTATATQAPVQPSATSTVSPSHTASVTLSPAAAYPGALFTVSGSGFVPGESVTFYWNGTAVTTVTASATGSVSVAASLSSTSAAGTRSVVLQGSTGDRASATFTVL